MINNLLKRGAFIIQILCHPVRGHIAKGELQRSDAGLIWCLFNKKGAGFTLIEVVITIGVFTLGIMATFSLALSNLRIVHENYDRVFAANLAREGIELIKNVRDSNWLKINANVDCDDSTVGLQLCAWNEGLSHNIGYYIVDYDSSSTYPPVQTSSSWTNDKKIYYDVVSGFYSHDSNDRSTNISRFIEIEAICLNTITLTESIPPSHGDCGLNEKQTGIKVTAHIKWSRYNKDHYLDIVDYLYNWR